MNRVAVTGMGVVSPLGNQVERFRDKLLAGTSGIGPLTRFPAETLPSRIAGQCVVENRHYKDRKIDFALLAAESALQQADRWGTPIKNLHDPHLCGLSLGIGLELFDMADMVRLAQNHHIIPEDQRGKRDFLQTPADWCMELLTQRFNLSLPPALHISACAAANDALGYAFNRIRRGHATLMLAGGTDSMINLMGFGGFCKLNALSTRNHEPEKASRPFDRQRDGFVLAEGAGLLVLEDIRYARQRHAPIYAEICGYGNSFDAYSVSDPHPEGRGAVLAIDRALHSAGIKPKDISYINAHGTATPKNDPVETLAIKTALGDHAFGIPISSTKSMIGHLISAAGAVETIAAITCANAGFVHPTINLDHPDPQCDLDYVPHLARLHTVDYFLKHSFAFGGQNSVLVLRNGTTLPC